MTSGPHLALIGSYLKDDTASMSAPDDDMPLSVNTGKHLVLKRPEISREATPRAFPPAERRTAQRPARIEHTEEQRAEALKYLGEPDREPPPSPPQIIEERKPRRARPIPYPDPDLIRWCEGYMRRMKSSRTAMEIVNYWYSTWRRHPEKPQDITSKHKPGYVDRVSKWLEHHEKAGRLRMVRRRKSYGKRRWPAKSYLPVEGAVWKRRRGG